MISQMSLLSLLSFIVSSKCCIVGSGPHLSNKEFEKGFTGIKKTKQKSEKDGLYFGGHFQIIHSENYTYFCKYSPYHCQINPKIVISMSMNRKNMITTN